ncbi:NYN domain-containing protein [Anaerosoma tenue]|uniref:NYN domain-containing protein n=1 Tax=Anaerosoma tenue TaxID=2933588 RepID=UPI002260ABEC|nr:NYN domain-containing protein [Anaerosoma tenue]MCK8115889.1 NYN domain-containing protein [Anaerosoma tenue]
MRFLVDGYNVTRSDPATKDLALEEQREALVARLAARRRELLGDGEVAVVFDGVAGGGSGAGRGAVEVRYARSPESADDLIARLAAGGGVTVVTSDGGLARRVEGTGAVVVPSATCFEGVRGRRRRGGRYPASTVGLPAGANEITRELKDLWLKDGE